MDSPINASPLPNHHETPSPPPAKPLESPESGHRPTSKLGMRTPEPEILPCPRCDSMNTKFCYYNNYNRSQPRHFCKSCRRYWTRGGALRNIPVGGSSRKTAAASHKRPRLSTTTATATAVATTSSNNSSLGSCSKDNEVLGKNLDPIVSNPVSDAGSAMDGARSFSCWWNSVGLLPINGYGFGLLPGLDYGNGLLDWPVVEQASNSGIAAAVSGEASVYGGSWQIGGGWVAEGSDYYFSWPELATPTPVKSLK